MLVCPHEAQEPPPRQGEVVVVVALAPVVEAMAALAPVVEERGPVYSVRRHRVATDESSSSGQERSRS